MTREKPAKPDPIAHLDDLNRRALEAGGPARARRHREVPHFERVEHVAEMKVTRWRGSEAGAVGHGNPSKSGNPRAM